MSQFAGDDERKPRSTWRLILLSQIMRSVRRVSHNHPHWSKRQPYRHTMNGTTKFMSEKTVVQHRCTPWKGFSKEWGISTMSQEQLNTKNWRTWRLRCKKPVKQRWRARRWVARIPTTFMGIETTGTWYQMMRLQQGEIPYKCFRRPSKSRQCQCGFEWWQDQSQDSNSAGSEHAPHSYDRMENWKL